MTFTDLTNFIHDVKEYSKTTKYEPYVNHIMTLNANYCSKQDNLNDYLNCMYEKTNCVMEHLKKYK